GLGDAEKVAPRQRDRDGFALDGSGQLVAFVLQRLQDRRGEAEIGKGGQLLILSRGCALAARPTCFGAQRNAPRTAFRHPACPRLSDEILGRSTGGRSGHLGPHIHPSRGWSAANRSSSDGSLSHVAVHKSILYNGRGTAAFAPR